MSLEESILLTQAELFSTVQCSAVDGSTKQCAAVDGSTERLQWNIFANYQITFCQHLIPFVHKLQRKVSYMVEELTPPLPPTPNPHFWLEGEEKVLGPSRPQSSKSTTLMLFFNER